MVPWQAALLLMEVGKTTDGHCCRDSYHTRLTVGLSTPRRDGRTDPAFGKPAR